MTSSGGKKNKKNKKTSGGAAAASSNSKYPWVSVITPTYNRRPFIETMFQIFRNQTYPKDRIEWIIIDDGTDKIADLVEKSGIPQIKYYALPEKITLGAKRNLCHSYTTGDDESILVYQDDDDWYSPERISHAVETLQKNPHALCVGASEIYIYFKHIKKMYQAGPYGPNHATAGTFAFRKKLLREHRYEDTACLAEEKAFLKNYTVPFAQLDPMKTILVFSHIHNTFDKKKLLENPHPLYFKESPKTVDMFLHHDFEKPIKKFFMEDIDALLAKYQPGDPSMKPDVLVQMKEIEKERARLMAEAQAKAAAEGGAGMPQIVMQREGEAPVTMSIENAVNLLTTQHRTIDELIRRNKGLIEKVAELEKRLLIAEKGGSVAAAHMSALPSSPQSIPPPFMNTMQSSSPPQPYGGEPATLSRPPMTNISPLNSMPLQFNNTFKLNF